jgi:hypothetical protein
VIPAQAAADPPNLPEIVDAARIVAPAVASAVARTASATLIKLKNG